MLKESLIFPIVQSVHLAGIALMVGTIVLADLSALGNRGREPSRSWTILGAVVMAVTGPILFVADIPRYVSNPAFLVKMVILSIAVLCHFTLHRKQTRTTALLSLILWTCVVLGGRAIADFDV
jgi:hypothetical protein